MLRLTFSTMLSEERKFDNMRKIGLAAAFAGLFLFMCATQSCMTQKKAEGYFDKHPEKAAKYLSEKFPLKPTTITEFIAIDSLGYEQAYNELLTFADSLLLSVRKDTQYMYHPFTEKKPNIDSIRYAVERKIRKALKPCIDSVKIITKIVPDSARNFYLLSEIKKYSADATYQKSRGDRNSKQRNWCIVIIILLLGWIFRKHILKLINPVTKFWPFLIIIWLASCKPTELIQVGLESVKIISIDTVTRNNSGKLYIILQSDRGVNYVCWADTKDNYIVGTRYRMFGRH